MSVVYTGRYDENDLVEGDIVEFLENTHDLFYPPGKRSVLIRDGHELIDENSFNGYDARYILVSSKSKAKGLANWLKERGL